MESAYKPYYTYRAHLMRLMRHPVTAACKHFAIRVQKELIFGKDNIGRYSVAVYLDCDHGKKVIEIYRPRSDEDARAKACAELLQEWLVKEGKAT